MAMDLRNSARSLANFSADTRNQIIEGMLTVVAAVAAWFVIVDFPDKAHKKGLLSQREADIMKHRLDVDRNDATPDPLTLTKFWTHLGDFKLWVFALMFMVWKYSCITDCN
jgi:hypothetical protein